MDYSQTVDDSPSSFKAGIRYALARWRERETPLIEKYSVLGRFVNPPRFLFALVIVLAVLFRVASLFAVSPGNAPDEFGHLVIALALSQPEVLTLKTEHNYSPYHYAIFDPLAYFPAAAMLHAGSKIDKTLNRMSIPMRISDRATYLARAGMLIWAAVFLVFLAKSARVHFGEDGWLAVGLCGLLPQLTFVQTYVNLDSMGVAAFSLLVWALSIRSLSLVTLAVALMANAKLNFLGTLPLPFVFFSFWYLPKIREFTRKTAAIPGASSSYGRTMVCMELLCQHARVWELPRLQFVRDNLWRHLGRSESAHRLVLENISQQRGSAGSAI